MTPSRLSNLRDLWPHLTDIERELVDEVEGLRALLSECQRQFSARVDASNEHDIQLNQELEQAKSEQVHCMACGGVECHRLAEIVKLTGVASDQHLVEWVEQAKEQFALLKAGCKIEVSRSLDFEKQFKQAKERLIQTTGKAAEHDAALEALSGTDERLPLFGRITQARTEAKERERQLQYDLSQPNPNVFVPSTTTDGTGNSEAFRELSSLSRVRELEAANALARQREARLLEALQQYRPIHDSNCRHYVGDLCDCNYHELLKRWEAALTVPPAKEKP